MKVVPTAHPRAGRTERGTLMGYKGQAGGARRLQAVRPPWDVPTLTCQL